MWLWEIAVPPPPFSINSKHLFVCLFVLIMSPVKLQQLDPLVCELWLLTFNLGLLVTEPTTTPTHPPSPVDALNRATSDLCHVCRLIAARVKPSHLTSCYVGHWSLQLAVATWCQHLVSGRRQRSQITCPPTSRLHHKYQTHACTHTLVKHSWLTIIWTFYYSRR